MSEQIIAYGATVERSLDGVTYTSIPEAKGIGVPAVKSEYQDVTNLDSEDGFREFIKGLKDAGEITIPMGYTAAGYEMMLADQAVVGAIYYRTTLAPQPLQASGDIFVFRAFPTPEIQTNDLGAPVDINVSLRTTGAPTWTRGNDA